MGSIGAEKPHVTLYGSNVSKRRREPSTYAATVREGELLSVVYVPVLERVECVLATFASNEIACVVLDSVGWRGIHFLILAW